MIRLNTFFLLFSHDTDEGANVGVYLLGEHTPVRLGVARQIADKSTNVDMSDGGYLLQLVSLWYVVIIHQRHPFLSTSLLRFLVLTRNVSVKKIS